MHYLELIRKRRSVRTFSSSLNNIDFNNIKEYVNKINNPFNIALNWHFIEDNKISVPVISGTDTYITATVNNEEYALEAFGYSFEKMVLYAEALDIGTTLIAGTMDRKGFEDLIGLKENELMPCISPLGYKAEKMSLKETLMRKGIRADSRKNNNELFFEESFAKPLALADNPLKDAFEAVRLSPSAINYQPWRLLQKDDLVHFFKKKSKQIENDIRRIDMGIALLHFELVGQENDFNTKLIIDKPEIVIPEDLEYVFSIEAIKK